MAATATPKVFTTTEVEEGSDKDEKLCNCQLVSQPRHPEPMRPTEMPMTTSLRAKCVTLTTPLKWSSHVNLFHVSKTTRGMATKKYFKRKDSLIFFYNTWCQNTKLVKDFHFSSSIVQNCSNTVIYNYNVFTSKRFARCKRLVL